MKLEISVSANTKPIRNCRNFSDDMGCQSGCRESRTARLTACPYEDGKDYEPNSPVKFQQDCKCFK